MRKLLAGNHLCEIVPLVAVTLVAVTLLAVPLVAPVVAAQVAMPPASQPAPALSSSAWALDFAFEDPQRISVLLPGESKPTTYWYMLYKVENPTAREIGFYPSFEIVTDKLEVIRSEQGVSPEAFEAVFRRANQPNLLPPEKIAGRILRGSDQARYGVAIWKDFDPRAKAFTVYAAGLSGETVRWRNPAFDADQPAGPKNQRYFLLRKTLAIPYALTDGRSEAVRLADKQRWVMR